MSMEEAVLRRLWLCERWARCMCAQETAQCVGESVRFVRGSRTWEVSGQSRGEMFGDRKHFPRLAE